MPYRLFLLACVLIVGFMGCKKNPCDELPPSIQLNNPSVGAVFYFQNTIEIRATITDDTKLESVTCEITDAQNRRYLQSNTFAPTGNSFDLNYSISHDDLYLTGGTYFVRITASDGENEQIAFREIQLVAAPRLLERVFAIRTAGNTTAIDTLHGNEFLPCISYEHNYAYGAIDSRSNQYVACSQNTTELASGIFPDFEELSVPFPLTDESITAFYHDKTNHRFYWGTQQGVIWQTDATGTRVFAALAADPIRVMESSSSHLVVLSEGATSNYLNALRISNGVVETAIPIAWEVKGLVYLPGDSQRMMLIGNQAGAAYFAWFNLDTSAINEVFNFYESSPVMSVCGTGANNFYVVHSIGVACYQNLLDSYTLGTSVVPDKIVYDDLENTLWGVTEQMLYRFDANAQLVLQSFPTSGLKDVWIKYNK
jgi:hypothetical protein